MMGVAFPSWMLNGAALLGVYMLAVSALTVLVYAKDKSAAERGLWRVRESTLHLWSLLGGWPGAYVAQRALRHKTRKDAFLARYRLSVAANCGVVALVFVLLAWSFEGFDGARWPFAAVAGVNALGESGAAWLEATAGALLGAVSMTVLRVPRMGHCFLAQQRLTQWCCRPAAAGPPRSGSVNRRGGHITSIRRPRSGTCVRTRAVSPEVAGRRG